MFTKIKNTILYMALITVILCSSLNVSAATRTTESETNVYTINGVQVVYTDASEYFGSGQCWNYAQKIYKKIWGRSFTSSFDSADNILRYYTNDEDLTLTPEHLRKYVLMAKPGAVLRLTPYVYLRGGDSSDWDGHSMMIVRIEEDGFQAIQGGGVPASSRDVFYTWEGFCKEWKGSRYAYIKYIKWPNAAASLKPSQKISVTTTQTKTIGEKAFSIGAKITTGDGKLTYTSSNQKVATVNAKGTVTLKGVGKTTIKVTAGKTSKYKTSYKNVTLTVLPKSVKVTSVVKTATNKARVYWTRNKDVTGYRVKFDTNGNFKNAKIVTITSNKVLSRTISVKKGKTYYVRIQTYKGNYSSKWSSIYKIKIK
ncbi:MAG: Ig-like domain-containing protein [Blautia sp.]|nr:Ig-like domain-containing protein [Blautia sp.]